VTLARLDEGNKKVNLRNALGPFYTTASPACGSGMPPAEIADEPRHSAPRCSFSHLRSHERDNQWESSEHTPRAHIHLHSD